MSELFNTERCSLPSIPAVDFKFISDCTVLPPPPAIFDCPDIEIPIQTPVQRPTAAQLIAALPAGAGGPGGPGPAGTCPPCVPYSGCTWWVWQCCPDSSLSLLESDSSLSLLESSDQSSTDSQCETFAADKCGDPPQGSWLNLSTGLPATGNAGEAPEPCWDGTMCGDTAVTCPPVISPIGCGITACPCYPFNGNGNDVSPRKLHLIERGTAAYVAGKMQQAAAFAGDHWYERCPDYCFDLKDGIVNWFWIRRDSVSCSPPGIPEGIITRGWAFLGSPPNSGGSWGHYYRPCAASGNRVITLINLEGSLGGAGAVQGIPLISADWTLFMFTYNPSEEYFRMRYANTASAPTYAWELPAPGGKIAGLDLILETDEPLRIGMNKGNSTSRALGQDTRDGAKQIDNVGFSKDIRSKSIMEDRFDALFNSNAGLPCPATGA